MKSVNIKTTYRCGIGLLVLLGALALGAGVTGGIYSARADDAAVRRYESYLLAEELRRSSDDLTRLARTFVATGEPKWEQQYQEILDIRNGNRPRPQAYERIYWDFRAAGTDDVRPAGERVALLDLMKRKGYAREEFDRLASAQANSDALVKAETIAMNMVKGLYEDGTGTFTRQAEPDRARALAMLHDLDYHRYKAQIMRPVDEFLTLLDQRTSAELTLAVREKEKWAQISMASTAALVLILLTGLAYLYRRTTNLIQEVSSIASGIASGHLTQEIRQNMTGQEGDLMRTMGLMQKQLYGVVGVIRGSADAVATSSIEIAQASADLSRRTEHQASALQETTATIVQLGQTVHDNASHARQANGLAQEASAVATRGGEAMEEVVRTMHHISESSSDIGRITGVIDSIAFQTNILALNAAVEAARAGDQGRGFAVVASEVRNLARRSAEAAKEIKTLIDRSILEVEEGTTQVRHAGDTMKEIVGSIRKVHELVGVITTASLEQSTGIQQVGAAVSEIDQATQQNAAMVEESTAAAEGLKTQAGHLVDAVAVFKLERLTIDA